MAVGTNKVQITEEIGIYLDEIRDAYPAIDEVWVVGARAADPAERHATWELLMFADGATLDGLRADTKRHRDDVVALVVTDGDRFAAAWGDGPSGRLTDWRWRREDPNAASYVDPRESGGGRQAARVR